MRILGGQVGLLGPRLLPVTSYGYQPPPGATAHGWTCANPECHASDPEAGRGWRKRCPTCGSPTDPLLDKPWRHEAEGAELQWLLQQHPVDGGGPHQDRWEVWKFREALQQGDEAAMVRRRTELRTYAAARLCLDPSWCPGRVYFHVVRTDLEAHDLDGAAQDLLHWISVSRTEDVTDRNTHHRTNARQVIDTAMRFFGAGGASHPRAVEVRQGIRKLGAAALQVLNHDTQRAVMDMERD